MAAPMESHGAGSSSKNEPESDDIPPDLDVMSPNFDPLKALYSSTVVLPIPSAKSFNNLGEYESFTTGRGRGKGRGQSEHAQRRRRKKELAAQAAGLIDTKQKARSMRNVLTRMTDYTKGPHSLLNTCVQKRIRVRVCVRSFKGLRGICTGYLIAFDRDMNLALSDVDEVYRIPSTGQRFFHEEKLTYSKIIECSKIRPSRKHGSVESHRSRNQGSSRDRGQGSSRDRGHGSNRDRRQGSNRDGYDDRKTRTKPQESKDTNRDNKFSSSTEDKRRGDRRKDGNEEDEEALHLKLENLKKELQKLSPEDTEETNTHDESRSKDQSKVKDDSCKRKTSSSSEEQLLEPMAFEKQLLKSRTTREKLTDPDKGQGSKVTASGTWKDKLSDSDKGQGSKVTASGEGQKAKTKGPDGAAKSSGGGGKIRIQPEDFQRRHVNQLFIRGDNVVLVSVETGLLASRWK